jgi:hypothetical protein
VRRAAVLVLAAALSSCGSSPGSSSTAPTATTQDAAPAPKLGPVTVTAPRPGHTLHAHTDGTSLVATLDVSGHADPHQAVFTQAACSRSSCQQITPTDRHGRWSTRSVVDAPAQAPSLRVTVGYTDPASGRVPITLTVKLRAVAAKTPTPAKHHHHAGAPVAVGTLPPIPAPTPTSSAVPPVVVPTAPAAGDVRSLIMIGDSLADGTRSALAADLPGWGVSTDARVGRPLAEGMAVLAKTPVTDPKTILAFSLFTNDEPTNVAALRQAVLTSVARLGSQGCAIWATIHRPPVDGSSYAAANTALATLAGSLHGRLIIVPWAQLVLRHPDWLAPDDVHGTTLGYQQRALLYAQAAQSCTA